MTATRRGRESTGVTNDCNEVPDQQSLQCKAAISDVTGDTCVCQVLSQPARKDDSALTWLYIFGGACSLRMQGQLLYVRKKKSKPNILMTNDGSPFRPTCLSSLLLLFVVFLTLSVVSTSEKAKNHWWKPGQQCLALVCAKKGKRKSIHTLTSSLDTPVQANATLCVWSLKRTI